MSLLEQYQQAIASGAFHFDPQQQQAAQELHRISEGLLRQQQRAFPLRLLKPKPVRGLYLWGSVGAGKSWLMNLFYHALPPTIGKQRLHFHAFMRDLHHQLTQLQGRANPLTLIAKQLAQTTQVLCFDEFLVQEIGDAMLLAGLLKALFAAGITLITTSNTAPDDLYRNGLQRERFLPAIALLKQHTTVIHLHARQDYRLRYPAQAGIYHFPNNEATHQRMKEHFQSYAHNQLPQPQPLVIANRTLPTLGVAGDVVWFDFQVLCHIPRSQIDYLEIAQQFKVVLLSNIPQLDTTKDNAALYLIHLVDILYDHRTKLILAAEVPLTELYTGNRWQKAFQRTLSRLTEMQSAYY